MINEALNLLIARVTETDQTLKILLPLNQQLSPIMSLAITDREIL
jgi:hypothetical protein